MRRITIPDCVSMCRNFIIWSFVFIAVSCNGTPTSVDQPKAEAVQRGDKAEAEEAKDSIPLILMGSFLNDRSSFTQREIMDGLVSGFVAVTSDLPDVVVAKWQLKAKPKVIDLRAFNQRNDTLVVLTTIDSVSNQFLSIAVDSINFFKNPKAYPLWLKGGSFSYDKNITSYIHTGVTAITRQTGVLLDRIPPEQYLNQIIGHFEKADLVHISNEVSLMDDCSYGSMRLQFATKRKHFDLIKMLGADIIELTGNHNLDFGKDPYMQSLMWYRENGMVYFGGGTNMDEAKLPLTMELQTGGKVAWIGYNELCPLGECAGKGPGAMRYEKSIAQKTIDSLRNIVKADYIIACVQFGETDSYSPTSSQKRICQEIVDLGADVVMGSQAHQAQEIALHKGKPIFYGLGNFLFDQIHRKGVRQAFFLECYFYKGRIVQFHPVYTYMSDQRIPSPANDSQREEIRSAILKPNNF